MKLKLLLITVLAFGGMAHAQGFMSNFSVGAGFEGIFPAATFTKSAAEISAAIRTPRTTTKSVGVVADARYDFGHHSALDFSFTHQSQYRNLLKTQLRTVTRVQTNNAEMIGTYIFRLPSNEKVKPYVLLGGGMVRFSPNNNYTTGLHTFDRNQARLRLWIWNRLQALRSLGHAPAISRTGPRRSRLQAHPAPSEPD